MTAGVPSALCCFASVLSLRSSTTVGGGAFLRFFIALLSPVDQAGALRRALID